MIDRNFFKKIRIMDGGMGQELLARGMEINSTLWSANAILDQKYHKLVIDIHSDFIKAGAEVIVTNTFTCRKNRLKQNNIENKFEELNRKAAELAAEVKKKYPNILIAAGLPPQNLTYEADDRDEDDIIKDFNDQAKILDKYIDFFYFDVLSSIKEIKSAILAVKEFNKPYLVGAHISEGTTLPSGEKISDIKDVIDDKILGIILACVSPENFELNINELKDLKLPFGFKLNGFKTTKIKEGYTSVFLKQKSNPNQFLGKRVDLTPEKIADIARKFKNAGATIIGGCCETGPSHILAISKIK